MNKVINKLELIELKSDDNRSNRFAQDIAEGLALEQKIIPSIYFYDKKGSQIFEKICDLDEYYQTRTEAKILKKYSDEIAINSIVKTDLIELGSGSSEKTKFLIDAFISKNGFVDYYPIDISGNFLLESAQILNDIYPELYIHPIAGRYKEGLNYIFNKKPNSQKLVLWLGSSIGNLNKYEAIEFLTNLAQIFRIGDRILIGMDLKKDVNILETAYDDSLNVTADFNLNLLSRINSELGGNFVLEQFEHRAIYNEVEGRIEMHLVSKKDQIVYISALNKDFSFRKDEYIHTENSHKYSKENIIELASRSGFELSNQWIDENRLFSLNEFRKKNKNAKRNIN